MTRRSPAPQGATGLVLTGQVEINVTPDSDSRRNATLDPPDNQLRSEGQATDGVQRAADGADDWWWAVAMRALKWLAQTPGTFAAWDLTLIGVPSPAHPNHWGALFRAAATAGFIQQAGYERSRRPGRAGGVCMVWVGCDAT